MATIAGTIRGATLVSKSFNGLAVREVWLLAADFGAYTASSDSATITGVGAAINATARDGATRTLRAGVCAYPGRDTANQAVYFGGGAVNACTVSGDDLTGDLNDLAVAEIDATASTGMGMMAFVDVS